MAFKRGFLRISEPLFAADRLKITDYAVQFPALQLKEQKWEVADKWEE